MQPCRTKVSIRRSGTVQFNRAALQQFRASDPVYVHFYRIAGGGGTRPLLGCERHALGLEGQGPFSQYSEDDPLEFLRQTRLKPRAGRLYRAWIEPRTRTIMVRIG